MYFRYALRGRHIRVAKRIAPSPQENNEKLVAAGEKPENKEKLAARLTACCEKNRQLEEGKEDMVNDLSDRRNVQHAKRGNFYASGCINTNCLSGKVAKGATENIAKKLNSSVDTSETESEDEQYDFDSSTSDTHFDSDAEFHRDLDSTSDRKSEPLPSAVLPPPLDAFELDTMVGQAYFGRTCTTEQDVVRHSSNIECPKESFRSTALKFLSLRYLLIPQIMLVMCQMVYASTPYLEQGNIEVVRTKVHAQSHTQRRSAKERPQSQSGKRCPV